MKVDTINETRILKNHKKFWTVSGVQHIPGLDELPPRPLPVALSFDGPPKLAPLFALLLAVPLPALLLLLSWLRSFRTRLYNKLVSEIETICFWLRLTICLCDTIKMSYLRVFFLCSVIFQIFAFDIGNLNGNKAYYWFSDRPIECNPKRSQI